MKGIRHGVGDGLTRFAHRITLEQLTHLVEEHYRCTLGHMGPRIGKQYQGKCAHRCNGHQKVLVSHKSELSLFGRMGKMTGFLARALGMWGIVTASEEGTIVVEGKARGTKKTVRELINCMKERGFAGGRVAISHCDNLAVAQTLKENILRLWGNSEIEIIPTRGLYSYYAERGGLIIGF